MAASSAPRRNKSLTWLVPASLGAGALALSLVTGSLGAFTASIANDTNTAGAGALSMQESWTSPSDTTVTCNSGDGANNAATCSTINKYGGKTTMAPGETATTKISLTNTGTVNVKNATLTPGACTPTPTPAPGAANLCSVMTVSITQDGAELFSGTAAALASRSPITLVTPAAGATTQYVITASLPATLNNTYAGTSLSQPLTWTYTA